MQQPGEQALSAVMCAVVDEETLTQIHPDIQTLRQIAVSNPK